GAPGGAEGGPAVGETAGGTVGGAAGGAGGGTGVAPLPVPGAAGTGGRSRPHFMQKRASSGPGVPQCGQ
ncbi:hypothetical protein PV515_42910, partial [Streptomyces scabiei]